MNFQFLQFSSYLMQTVLEKGLQFCYIKGLFLSVDCSKNGERGIQGGMSNLCVSRAVRDHFCATSLLVSISLAIRTPPVGAVLQD